jgi:hypothetical protein
MGQVKWSFSGVARDGGPLHASVEEVSKEESQKNWDGVDESWEEFFAGESTFFQTRHSGQLAELTTAIVFEMEFLLDNIGGGREADKLRKEYKKMRARVDEKNPESNAKAAKTGR